MSDQRGVRLTGILFWCHLTENLYHRVGKMVIDEDIKRVFERYARQRSRFCEELGAYVEVTDQEKLTKELAQLSVALNQTKSTHDILGVCVNLERQMASIYRHALAAPREDVQVIIESQAKAVNKAYDYVYALYELW